MANLSLTHQSIGGLLRRSGLEQIAQDDYRTYASGFSISTTGSGKGLCIQVRLSRIGNLCRRITLEGHIRVKILEALYEASKTLPMDVFVQGDFSGKHPVFGNTIYVYPKSDTHAPTPNLNPDLELVVKDYMRRSTQAELDQLGDRVESARKELESAQAFYMELSEKYSELQKELEAL